MTILLKGKTKINKINNLSSHYQNNNHININQFINKL